MFVRDLLVSCNATDVGTMMFANSHKPLDRHRARLRPSLSAQRWVLGTRGLSRQPAWVGRATSRVSCRWHWNPSWACNPSRRCKKTGRERSLGHRSSVSVPAARIARARRRQAQDGRKGIGIISSGLVPAFDLPLGPWSQKLDHIGASGIIVIRIPKWSPARSALAALPRRAAKKDAFQIWFHTHDCSSHLGGPGEPGGATRDPRGRDLRRPDGPDDDGRSRRHFPGRVKG